MRKSIVLLAVVSLAIGIASMTHAGSRTTKRLSTTASAPSARTSSVPVTVQRLLGDRLQRVLRRIETLQSTTTPVSRPISSHTIIDDPDPVGVTQHGSKDDESTEADENQEEQQDGADARIPKPLESFN